MPPPSRFEQVAVQHPALDRLMDEFRAVCADGDAIVTCFTALDGRTSDWAVSTTSDRPFNSMMFDFLTTDIHRRALTEFLVSPTVVTALKLPAYEDDSELLAETIREHVQFIRSIMQYMPSLKLDGDIALALVRGGFARTYQGTAAQARALAQAACDVIFGGRYEDVWVYTVTDPWCGWFRNPDYGHTWVLIDDRENKLWLLCVTDSDDGVT